MSALNILKLKRILHITTASIFVLSLFITSLYLPYITLSGSKMTTGGYFMGYCFLIIVYCFISLVISALIEVFIQKLSGKETHFISGVFSIGEEIKYIYDSNSGYYIGILDDTDGKLKLTVYKQNILSLTEIFYIDLVYCINEEDIKNNLKILFDNMDRENNFKKSKRKYSTQYEHFKNWDGYVDKQSRRDGFLDKFL